MKTVKELQQELKDFLKKRPHLREYQREIDAHLKFVDTPEERMKILKESMAENLNQINKLWRQIGTIFKKTIDKNEPNPSNTVPRETADPEKIGERK